MADLENPIAIRSIAMDMLALREHGRLELKRKLLRKGIRAELIDPVLDTLTADNLLSEQRYLESFIRSRANSGYGPIRIKQELLQKSIASDVIKQALQQADYDWAEQLQQVWQRKFNQPAQNPKEKAKQIRFLLYRGFSMDLISQLFK